jgi:hypothetical protein
MSRDAQGKEGRRVGRVALGRGMGVSSGRGVVCEVAGAVRARRLRHERMEPAAVLRPRPGAHPALGIDVGTLLHQALGHSRLVVLRRTEERSRLLCASQSRLWAARRMGVAGACACRGSHGVRVRSGWMMLRL